MHVITASDLYDDTTWSIKDHVYNCRSSLMSTIGWPWMKAFPPSWVKTWRSILTSLILPRLKANPLGEWVHQSHIVGAPVIVEDDCVYEPVCKQHPNPSEKDFVITSPKFAALVRTIQTRIKKSEKWLRYFWGKSKLSHRTIYNIIRSALNDDLVIATDASVKYGRAAHAFCFAGYNKGNVIFSTGSKVPGPTKHLTSYRAEMTSITNRRYFKYSRNTFANHHIVH